MGTKVTVNTTGGSKVGIKNQQQEVIRTVGVSSAEGLVAYTLADYAMNTAQSAYAQANAAPSIANTYAYSVGISSNNYAGDMANSANGYAVTVGLSGNNFAGAIVNTATLSANNYAGLLVNTASTSANNFAGAMANSVNSYATSVGSSGNSYTISVGASSNAYANAVGISGNNYAGAMANSANSYAASISSIGNTYLGSLINTATSSANNFAGAMVNSANAWANTKLANTSGVVFGGDLAIKGNVVIGTGIAQTSSYALQVTGNTGLTGYGVAKNLHVQGGNNLLTYSEQFDNAAWTKNQSTVTADAVSSPDGTTTADKLIENTASASHAVYRSATVTTSTYTFSVYLKAAERSFAAIGFTDGGTDYAYRINLSTGAITLSDPNASAVVTSVGNGWWRLAVTRTLANTSVNVFITIANSATGNIVYTGDGASGIYVWGAQLEQGRVASPYTQTVASAVTASNTLEVQGKANITSNLIVQGSDITQAILSGNNYAGSMVNTATVSANNYAGAMINTATVSANNYAGFMVNSANAWANTKLSISGGTIAGDLQITGNLSIVGNTNFVNTVSYIVTDPLIYIAGNNYVSDIVTIGIVANYNNGACSTVHTGLIRDPVTKQYYIFNGYDKEPGPGNNIDVNGNNFTIGVLNADIVTNNVVLNGSNLRISLASINSYTNAVAVSANAWSNTKLANTSGVVFGGDLAIKGNVVIGTGIAQTSSYALQVTGNSAITGYEVARNVHVQGGNNLFTYSEQFDNVAWSKTRTTISTNTITAPDGTLTADKLVETATTGQHLCGQSAGSQSAGSFVFSAYLKAGERFRGECTVGNAVGGANGFYASFNLNTGTATLLGQFGTGFTGVSASLINIGNGWYRFALVGTTSSTGTVAGQINLYDNSGTISYTGDGTSGLYIWGAQFEQGLVASPYIQTVASAVTASNTLEVQGKANISGDLIVAGNVTLGDASTDTITLNGSTISLGNNQNIDAGTLFVDAINNRVGIGTTSPLVKLDVTGSGTAIIINSDDNNGAQLQVRGVNNANNRLYIGYDTDDNVGRILAITEGVAFRNLILQDGGGNIGIGTALPNALLHANGTANIASTANIGGNMTIGYPSGGNRMLTLQSSGIKTTTLSTTGGGFEIEGAVGDQILYLGKISGSPSPTVFSHHIMSINGNASGYFRWAINTAPKMTLDTSGSLGIGTTTPAANLNVIGSANITGDFIVTGNVTLGDASTDTITLRGSTISLGNNQNIDAGTLFIDAVNNEIGIGTTNPTSNLHVIGTANITSNTIIQGSLNVSCTNASIALTTLYSPTPNTPAILFKQNTDTFRISYNPNNKLSFTGSVTGQELFSIVDSFTNVIYSITTSDGIPVVEIFNSGKTNLNQWVGNVSIGANNTTNTYLQIGNNTTLYSQSISSGGLTLSLATKTSAYTLTSNDRTILANAALGGFSLTLPGANTNVGRFYTIKKIDSSANVVSIVTTFAQTIDGAATMNLNAQYATLSMQSDGSNWYIV